MLTYPPDLEDYVRQKIETGQFHSRDALAIEAVRIYRELDTRFQALKAEIQVGLDEANRGEVEPLNLESIMQELREELDENGRPVR